MICPHNGYSGAITNLRKILIYADDYPDDRKPHVKVTIKPSGNADVVHECDLDDVGEHDVRNLPNYGAAVNSVIVQVQTITTSTNHIRLCWSKTFDLNQSWWSSLKDTALSGNAEIKVGSYCKSITDGRTLILRKVDNEYKVLNQNEVSSVNGIIDCDVEIISSDNADSPTLSKDIYINGKYDERLAWAEPIAVKLL